MDESEAMNDVRNALLVDVDNSCRLRSRESTRLEYKESFHWNGKDEYLRTLAAFANTQGGHIIFGVKNAPRDLLGLLNDRFERLDPARLGRFMSDTLAPIPRWAMFEVSVSGVKLGVLSVKAVDSKPVIVTRNTGVLKEGDIYYRYRASTERIKFSDLNRILLEREAQERQRWMRLFGQVGRIGVENLGLLDLADGEITGRTGKLLIDPSLLEKIKFIQEGRFSENSQEGLPTLRLIGDVTPAEPALYGRIRRVPAPVVLSEKEVMVGFLRMLQPDNPRMYLIQACRENSSYMPIYYFGKLAKLGTTDLLHLVSQEGRQTQVIEQIQKRVKGLRVGPRGSLRGAAGHQRQQILEALHTGDLNSLAAAERNRLFEAVTHFKPKKPPVPLLSFFADLVDAEFTAYPSNLKSLLRKAIAHLDEVLNGY